MWAQIYNPIILAPVTYHEDDSTRLARFDKGWVE